MESANLFAIESLLEELVEAWPKTTLSLPPSCGSTFLRGDRAELYRALMAILDVFLIHADERGTRVSCRTEDDRVVLTFEGSPSTPPTETLTAFPKGPLARAQLLLLKNGGELDPDRSEEPGRLEIELPYLAWSLSRHMPRNNRTFTAVSNAT